MGKEKQTLKTLMKLFFIICLKTTKNSSSKKFCKELQLSKQAVIHWKHSCKNVRVKILVLQKDINIIYTNIGLTQ